MVPDLSVVLPVYNEEASLREVHRELLHELRRLARTAEVLYVDDGSTDGSRELLLELATERLSDVAVRAVLLRRNFGQTAALAAGFDMARGRVVVAIDADGQNDPADIGRLLARLEDGYEVVSGWRRRRQDRALLRRLPSWMANHFISWLSGVRLHDSGCTLKAYRGTLVRRLRLWGDMHRFIPAYLARQGARITELEVAHRPRLHGRSHYGSERIVPVLLDLVMIRFMAKYFTRPLHFFGRAALLFLAGAFGCFSLMVVFKYGWLRLIGIDYRASFVETPLPSLVATLTVGSILSLFSGILAEMLVRLYHEIGDVRPYSIETTAPSELEMSAVARHDE